MNEPDQNRTCSRCGASLAPGTLGGLCPRCLMALNLETQTEVPGEAAGPAGTRIIKPTPTPTEIAGLFPQFEILECLGRGGMGVVYKARQPRLDRFVALKLLLPRQEGSSADTAFAERFAREARALARLSHPDIVAVYDYGEAGGYPFLVMEFVDGLTLRQLLQHGKLAPEQALTIVPKICAALEFAHQKGVVHRDIKPENILLDKQGQVKIADFGIAKILAPGPQDQALTGGKDIVGTPHYMAPEQVEQPNRVDHRADIFSLGVVFYEMLTGELPLGKFQPPSKKVHVDVRLDEVVLRALEKEPERRYQQASQVRTDVESIASTPQAEGSGATQASPEPTRKTATQKTHGEFLGIGAAIQAVGLACFFIPDFGFILGIVLLLIGGRMALKRVCSECGNATSRGARLCASCGATFVEPETPGPVDKRRRAALWYCLVISVIGLPVGIAMNLPTVWVLALAGIIIGSLKLGFLERVFVSPNQPGAAGLSSYLTQWQAAALLIASACFLVAAIINSDSAHRAIPMLNVVAAVAFLVAAARRWAASSRRDQTPNPAGPPPQSGEPVDAPGSVPILKWTDLWMWDTAWIVVILVAPAIAAAIALPFLLPVWGLKALWILSVEFLGIAFAATYGWVGYRVRSLKQKLPQSSADVAEALMFRRPIQSPGLAVLHPDRLELIPIMSAPITVTLHDIKSLAEVRWFNGTRLWTKCGFVMELANGQRVGVAVPAPFARRWRARLSRGSLPEIPASPRGASSQAGLAPGARWTARVLGTLWALMYLVFVVAEGSPPILKQPPAVQVEFAAIALMLAGIGAGWWRDGLAAVLTLAGWVAFHLAEGSIDAMSLFHVPAVAGVLFGTAWGLRLKGRERLGMVGGLAVFPLAFALLLYVVSQWGAPGARVTVSGVVTDVTTRQPIARARVDDNAHGAGTQQAPRQTWTRTNGDYELETFYEEHTLAASAPGYQTVQTTLRTKPFGFERKVHLDFALPPAVTNTTPGPDMERAVLLFNDIEDSGHEIDAAVQSRNLAAAQTTARRLHRLLTDFNAAVRGTDLEFPQQLFNDLASVRQALDDGDWEKALQGAKEKNEETSQAFKRIAARMVEAAKRSPQWTAQHIGGAAAPVPGFGEVLERVLSDPDDPRGGDTETLNLRAGKLSSELRGTKGESGAGVRMRKLVASSGDLFAEYDDFVSGRWALVTAGLKLGDLTPRQWDTAVPADVAQALETPTVLQRVERYGSIIYLLPQDFLPMTFAFESRAGDRGFLQVTALSTNPRTLTIRYKQVGNNPGTQPPIRSEPPHRP